MLGPNFRTLFAGCIFSFQSVRPTWLSDFDQVGRTNVELSKIRMIYGFSIEQIGDLVR